MGRYLKISLTFWRRHVWLVALSALLTACFTHVILERDAPELGKPYVLTEDLVLGDTKMFVPTFGQPLRVVPYVGTRPYFRSIVSNRPGATKTDLDSYQVIESGSRVHVEKVFLSVSSTASIRKAELWFTDPETGVQTKAYATWADVGPKLGEQKNVVE